VRSERSGLADVGDDRADDAVERRDERGVVEVELGLLDGELGGPLLLAGTRALLGHTP
jgi:hypothetical protein